MTLARRLPFLALPLVSSLAACDLPEPTTNADFRAAMDEVVLTGQAVSLQDGIVEITTSFTLADGAAAVAQEVRTFVTSQIPCSTIESPEPQSLRIDFGDLSDACTYRGRTYAGVVTISYSVQSDEVVVVHEYDELTNGIVTMNGQADVTWTEASRRVQTDFAFSGLDRTLEVDSDRTQVLIGELGDGIRVDGERNWTTDRGTWNLEIDGVEMRGIDPVPQAGSYNLVNPEDKEMSLSFERVDDDTIAVTISSGRRSRTFHVSSTGGVQDMG